MAVTPREAMAAVIVPRVREKAGCVSCSLLLYENPRSPARVWAKHGVAGVEQRQGFDPEGAWVSRMIEWVRAGHDGS